MAGQELLDMLIHSSGLPEYYVRERMEQLISQSGLSAETLSIDQVRDLLSNLLLDMINESLTMQA